MKLHVSICYWKRSILSSTWIKGPTLDRVKHPQTIMLLPLRPTAGIWYLKWYHAPLTVIPSNPNKLNLVSSLQSIMFYFYWVYNKWNFANARRDAQLFFDNLSYSSALIKRFFTVFLLISRLKCVKICSWLVLMICKDF